MNEQLTANYVHFVINTMLCMATIINLIFWMASSYKIIVAGDPTQQAKVEAKQ